MQIKLNVIKKDGTLEPYDEQKIIDASYKAAIRATCNLTEEDYRAICCRVFEEIESEDFDNDEVPVTFIHSVVEKMLLKLYPSVGQSYQQYRNYKLDFVKMMDKVYEKSQSIRYIGDVSNANSDSTMISTQRSLIYGQLNEELYKKFFLNKEELQASNEGYIYIHDKKDRLDGINCNLFNIQNVIAGGFEMGNVWYNEPKTLDVAFDVISDVVMAAASQQYGGFTVSEVDKLLAPYAEKSYKKYYDEYFDNAKNITKNMVNNLLDNSELEFLANKHATNKVYRDMEQGFQSWEYRFNTVSSSRGDYPFTSISFGIGRSPFETMASECALKVRMNGQGKQGHKKIVLFPKLTFLYEESLHGAGKELEWLFNISIECSKKAMYPDFLSLSGKGYIPEMYKKYGKVVSLMGCRASLSPWYEKGGMTPLDESDAPVFVGRCNLGAVTLHLPMILQKCRQENQDFYKILDYYLELIRNLHKRTFNFLGEKKASTNPLAFTQGGLLGGTLNPNDKIKSLLSPMTMSFGITALNELQQLYNGKSIVEDGNFAIEVMQYINNYINRIKTEDNILYAIYATPAESLCGTQIEQFRKIYGIIEGVSDRAYTTNSFHCGVWEDISPIQKQDLEGRFWDLFNGGKIQYVKYPIDYNTDAIKTLVRRAMDMGFYEGINMELSYCEDCGYEQLDMDICPKCSSEMITKISRMNGYLGYTKIHGKSRYNASKMAEIEDRVSM